MEERYRELLARGAAQDQPRRRAAAAPGGVRRARVLPRLPRTASNAAEFAELLRDLVARGRAAGVIVCAATQKPAADVVPSALRDLFGFRLALRCNTPQASDTILGQGWASARATAPPRSRPGSAASGYLLAEDGLPVRMRGFHLRRRATSTRSPSARSALRADAWLDRQRRSERR